MLLSHSYLITAFYAKKTGLFGKIFYRQEGTGENDEGSTGGSPPLTAVTITSGLSVAQAVKKNTKMAAENAAGNRPRRHSTSASSGPTPDIQESETSNRMTVKSPKLSSSFGDKDGGGTKTVSNNKEKTKRPVGGKKIVSMQPNNQAPRLKKQQQQQSIGTKKVPSRPESASPSSDNAGFSVPASLESSPTSTLAQNDNISSVSGNLPHNGPTTSVSEALPNRALAGYSDERYYQLLN